MLLVKSCKSNATVDTLYTWCGIAPKASVIVRQCSWVVTWSRGRQVRSVWQLRSEHVDVVGAIVDFGRLASIRCSSPSSPGKTAPTLFRAITNTVTPQRVVVAFHYDVCAIYTIWFTSYNTLPVKRCVISYHALLPMHTMLL